MKTRRLRIADVSLSDAMTMVVVTIVFVAVMLALIIFNAFFRDSIIDNAQ